MPAEIFGQSPNLAKFAQLLHPTGEIFMKENCSAIFSEYIIDGVLMDARPVDMLSSGVDTQKDAIYEQIVDESLDLPLAPEDYDEDKLQEYLCLTVSALGKKERAIQYAYSAFHTKLIIAVSIIASAWKDGHFGLADLVVDLAWKWNTEPVGAMSSFYRSVEAACEYLDGLGVRISGYSFEKAERCSLSVGISLDAAAENDFDKYESKVGAGVSEDYDDEENGKSMGVNRKCPFSLGSSPSDWIIYVPFDTCDYKLGGSLLSELTGKGGAAPDICDPDYFMDCYELIREMVEDGVVKAGLTVGTGGLITSLRAFLPSEMGMDVNLGDILREQEENSAIRLLFSEVPGAIIEVSDSDYDYIDAEFLLQDVAYFPLGHAVKGHEGLRVLTADSLSGILRALLSGQVSEGED